MSDLFAGTRSFASGFFTTLLFLFFLLVAGDIFLQRLVEIMPRFSGKRQVVDIAKQIESDISAYLLTITVMNAADLFRRPWFCCVSVAAGLSVIEPCLPSPAEDPPSGAGWLHEIKHDGFRIMARRDGAGVRLDYSRGVYVRPRPRSRISAYSALPPYTEAFNLTLFVPLLTKLLKLAAARIARQLGQQLSHKRNLCIVIDARA